MVMDKRIIDEYVERIYMFARKRCSSSEETEELAQEILYQACRSINDLRNEERFEPWLFGLANNIVKSFRLMRGRERALYAYDVFDLCDMPEPEVEDNHEEIEILRKKLAALSSQYREIMIMHYYDGKSCLEIADILKIPVGTVKWRLSEGRQRIKKEWSNVKEEALKPKKIDISINGNGSYDGKSKPYPSQYINDAVSQNILWYAYEEPKSVEELSTLTGIPAYYIEDRIDNLKYREAIIEKPSGKYQTNFMIHKNSDIKNHIERGKLISEKVWQRFIDIIDDCMDSVMNIGFYTAGRTREELKWLVAILGVINAKDILNPITKSYNYKVRYDGYAWAYHAYEAGGNRVYSKDIGANASFNSNEQDKFSHIVYSFNIDPKPFPFRRMMYSNEIDICQYIIKYGECREEDKEHVARMIKDKYIVRDANGLHVNIPFFTVEQKKKLDDITHKALETIAEEYKFAVNGLMNGYIAQFPKHLEQDAYTQTSMQYISLLAFITEDGLKHGRLVRAGENICACDVLIQNSNKCCCIR